MVKYKTLIKQVVGKDELETFKNVNHVIDSILQGYQENERIMCIKALICDLEGRIGRRNGSQLLALASTFLVAAIAVFQNISGFESISAIVGCIIYIAAFAYVLLGLKNEIMGYSCNKEEFVLSVLKFKLEELTNESELVMTGIGQNRKQFCVDVQEIVT